MRSLRRGVGAERPIKLALSVYSTRLFMRLRVLRRASRCAPQMNVSELRLVTRLGWAASAEVIRTCAAAVEVVARAVIPLRLERAASLDARLRASCVVSRAERASFACVFKRLDTHVLDAGAAVASWSRR